MAASSQKMLKKKCDSTRLLIYIKKISFKASLVNSSFNIYLFDATDGGDIAALSNKVGNIVKMIKDAAYFKTENNAVSIAQEFAKISAIVNDALSTVDSVIERDKRNIFLND